MLARYEVTYRNMWPSEALNACIRDRAGELREAWPGAECAAWFERREKTGELEVRVEVVARGEPHDALRLVGPRASHENVCATIDELFARLRRELVPGR
jgi:hypothetical protein